MSQEVASLALNGINPIYPRVNPTGSVSKALPRQLAAGLALEEGRNATNTLGSDEAGSPPGSGTATMTTTTAALNNTIAQGGSAGGGGTREQLSSMHAAVQLLQLAQLDFKPQMDFLTTNRVVAVLEKAVERLQLLSLLDTNALPLPRNDSRGGGPRGRGRLGESAQAAESYTRSAVGGAGRGQKGEGGAANTIESNEGGDAEDEAERTAAQVALANMLGIRRSNKVRGAAVFATSEGQALRGTTAAVTAALLRAASAPQRGRPTVGQLMAEQQQLEARYGELLLATRHAVGGGGHAATQEANNNNNNDNDDSNGAREGGGGAVRGAEIGVSMPQCFSHTRDPVQAALQHELRTVAAKLRDHNKILCTQLKDNPKDADNWNKICNERRELIALLQAAIAELTTGYQEACRSKANTNPAMAGTGLDLSLTHTAALSQTTREASTTLSDQPGNDAASTAQSQSQSQARRNSSSSDHSILSKATMSDVHSLSQSNATATLSKRFGSMAQLRKANKNTGAVARIPLNSSYESFASKVLQEQAAQRWADELVRKERELNQNVKQLQSDLMHERNMKAKELAERQGRIAQLRLQLRERRAALREAGNAARAHERAAAEALGRAAHAADRDVVQRMASDQRVQSQEEQTFALFAAHITDRTAAMDSLAARWEQKNQLEIKRMEASKLDAEQTWQHSAERLEECRRNEVVQQELQRQREEQRRVEEAARAETEQKRQSEYDAASVLESAIKATFTRLALAKLRKAARRKKKTEETTA